MLQAKANLDKCFHRLGVTLKIVSNKKTSQNNFLTVNYLCRFRFKFFRTRFGAVFSLFFRVEAGDCFQIFQNPVEIMPGLWYCELGLGIKPLPFFECFDDDPL